MQFKNVYVDASSMHSCTICHPSSNSRLVFIFRGANCWSDIAGLLAVGRPTSNCRVCHPSINIESSSCSIGCRVLKAGWRRKLCLWSGLVASAPRWTHAQECFTVSEVAADWHELIIVQRIMWPPIARVSEQLDPQCSMQTYHRFNQLHIVMNLYRAICHPSSNNRLDCMHVPLTACLAKPLLTA